GALLAAFDRASAGTGEMLLVAGYSGIGKSAVVNEVHKPIVARRGCFVAGKFDQYRRHVPYASLIQAFQELIRQLLSEPEEQVQQWAGKLREALAANLGVIIELIPDLVLITGAVEPVAALPPVESQNRLNRVFQRFVQVFSSASHPLVIFLDDLQWADAPTLKMMELFMREPEERYMLFIGAYRDNEVDAAHPLMALSETLHKAGVRLTTLTLSALSEQHVAQLNADTLRASVDECAPLTRLCYQKTGGNPFFVNQFLHAIHEAGHLRYHFGQNSWRWDMQPLENADYTDNVVDLMLEKIRRLPQQAQRMLQLAASTGNRFTLQTLAVVGETSLYAAQQTLWPALKAGLIHPLDHSYKYLDEDEPSSQSHIGYRFLHDRVQQAAYAIADDHERRHSHLKIGRLLYRNTPPELLDEQLFVITDQLNAGRDLMPGEDEHLLLAELNLSSGIKAKSSAAFQAALRHMRIGAALLPEAAWQQHAALYLDLQLGLAEAAYLCGEFDVAEEIYPVVIARCTAPLEKIRCITIQAHQYQLQGRLLDAIGALRGGLALLGTDIPDDDAALLISIENIAADVERLCAGKSMEVLLDAGDISDANSIAAMGMMQSMWVAAYYAGRQPLNQTMLLSMTRLSLLHGNSDFTSAAYVGYASFVAVREGNDESNYRFGAMALELANRRSDLKTRALTCLMFATLINHWSRPLSVSDTLYDDAFGYALDSGDFVNVGVVAAVRATDRLILGQYLPDLLQATERDILLMRANGQATLADCTVAGAVQPIKSLMGMTASAGSYDDGSFSEQRFMSDYSGSPLYQAYFLQGKIRNAYFFDSADAEALAAQLGVVAQMLRGQAKAAEASFYAAMIWVRALRRGPQRADAATVSSSLQTLQGMLASWSALGPHNFSAKHLLLQAETARWQQDMPLAMRCYQQAIDTARDTGYVNLQALACELCGEFWREQGQRRAAEVFLRDALSLYRQWGAEGKAAQLAALHTDLLEPSATSRHAVPGSRSVRQGLITGSIATTSTASVNAALDLASIVKASLALSNEVGLRKVLQRLIAIVQENSGAQVARLLLLSGDVWRVEADIAGDSVAVLQSRTVLLDAGSDSQFPLSLLRYAARTGAEVIEDRIASSLRFSGDPYVLANKPGSVMCLPIRQAGLVSGILYLENNLAEASFTAERVEFLRILSAQAMISISHARLYDSLEQRVAERTAQLEDANRRLATLSATDGLTGLANRRHFDEILGSEWARASRTRQPLAIIMIDVDHFKKYNDYYGHLAGDECLKTVARVLQEGSRRASDLAARYGGEEFSIVLPNTDAAVANRVAEAMRRAIEDMKLPHERSPLGLLTISVGVAIESHWGGGDPESLVRAADDALYRAKRDGRNCVVLTQG
uniref:diguanylate cyclase n=1 Tax=Undibacterium sp. TaxID=1914977 RepID=UPI00374D7196